MIDGPAESPPAGPSPFNCRVAATASVKFDVWWGCCIPVPSLEEPCADLPANERGKVRFFHMNHTNPLLVPGTEARRRLRAAGMHVACDGEVHDL